MVLPGSQRWALHWAPSILPEDCGRAPGMGPPQGKWDTAHSGPQTPRQHSLTEGFGCERTQSIPLSVPEVTLHPVNMATHSWVPV